MPQLPLRNGLVRAFTYLSVVSPVCVVQMTATQLFKKTQEEKELANMKEEARRLEEEAAAQAAARRVNEEHHDADAPGSVGAETEDDDGPAAEEHTVSSVPESDGIDMAAVAMRRKVERDREIAAKTIQQAVRR